MNFIPTPAPPISGGTGAWIILGAQLFNQAQALMAFLLRPF